MKYNAQLADPAKPEIPPWVKNLPQKYHWGIPRVHVALPRVSASFILPQNSDSLFDKLLLENETLRNEYCDRYLDDPVLWGLGLQWVQVAQDMSPQELQAENQHLTSLLTKPMEVLGESVNTAVSPSPSARSSQSTPETGCVLPEPSIPSVSYSPMFGGMDSWSHSQWESLVLYLKTKTAEHFPKTLLPPLDVAETEKVQEPLSCINPQMETTAPTLSGLRPKSSPSSETSERVLDPMVSSEKDPVIHHPKLVDFQATLTHRASTPPPYSLTEVYFLFNGLQKGFEFLKVSRDKKSIPLNTNGTEPQVAPLSIPRPKTHPPEKEERLVLPGDSSFCHSELRAIERETTDAQEIHPLKDLTSLSHHLSVTGLPENLAGPTETTAQSLRELPWPFSQSCGFPGECVLDLPDLAFQDEPSPPSVTIESVFNYTELSATETLLQPTSILPPPERLSVCNHVELEEYSTGGPNPVVHEETPGDTPFELLPSQVSILEHYPGAMTTSIFSDNTEQEYVSELDPPVIPTTVRLRSRVVMDAQNEFAKDCRFHFPFGTLFRFYCHQGGGFGRGMMSRLCHIAPGGRALPASLGTIRNYPAPGGHALPASWCTVARGQFQPPTSRTTSTRNPRAHKSVRLPRSREGGRLVRPSKAESFMFFQLQYRVLPDSQSLQAIPLLHSPREREGGGAFQSHGQEQVQPAAPPKHWVFSQDIQYLSSQQTGLLVQTYCFQNCFVLNPGKLLFLPEPAQVLCSSCYPVFGVAALPDFI